MFNPYYKQIVLFLIIVFCLACGRKNRLHLNEKQDKFITVYSELLVLKEKHTQQDSLYINSSQTILKNHQFTKNEFDQILSYYQTNPERWETFYKEVLKKMETINKSSEAVHH